MAGVIECVTFAYGGTLTSPCAARDPVLGMRPVTEDAARTIQHLASRNLLWVLLSNTGPGQDRTRALARAGILELFTAVLQSSELGLDKPDPLAYAQICHAIHRPPHQVMLVGNNFTNDVTAPMASGMRAALLRPHGLAAEEIPLLPRGAHVLRRVSDVSGLLDSGEKLYLP
ncbi:HAD family hydrolase [Actinomadura litoris]|uniref:HAD family hydrolase n=1 Tax=Actinomadura litoris TaxID=2678616 RepID=UPI001FA6CE82|nr:HAD family hydrolase [Actinomadura litoris]